MKLMRDAQIALTEQALNPRLRVLLMAAAGVGCLSGCAMIFGASPKMNVSPSIPAAEGKVRFKRSTNDNTSIKLKVHHLANPEKLTPAAKNYVVWVSSSPTAPPQNIGALEVDKDLTGTLVTVSPLHSFSLFITGEASGQIQQPTGPKLMWTDHND